MIFYHIIFSIIGGENIMIKKFIQKKKTNREDFSRQSTHSLQGATQSSGKQNPPTVKPNTRDKGGK